MPTHDKLGKRTFLPIMVGLLGLSVLANAESDAARAIRASAANVPTNIPGIRTYATPPEGFNPLTASDEQLATYGFPPKPDKQANPDQYALWQRAVRAAKIRWNGEMKLLPGIGHSTQSGSSSSEQAIKPQATGPQKISTINTSGVILTNAQKKWSTTSSFDNVSAEFTVPVVQLPVNVTCVPDYSTGAFEYSLVGIDGFFFADGVEGANPVFEPGLLGGVWESVPNCSGGLYYAVYGFGGLGGYIDGALQTFAVNPGDTVGVTVQALGPNSGNVFISDLTTSTSAVYQLTNTGPGGNSVQLVGYSAEWIVLRGCCNGPSVYGTWELPDTLSIFENGGYAETGNGKMFYPGSQASSSEILTMTDDKGDQAIEILNGQGSTGYQGQHSLWFTTEGCAIDGGCTP